MLEGQSLLIISSYLGELRKNIPSTIETIVVTVLLKLYLNMTIRDGRLLTNMYLIFKVSCKCFHLVYQELGEIPSFRDFSVQVSRL